MHFPKSRKQEKSLQIPKENKKKSDSNRRTRRGKLISVGYLFPSAAGVLLFLYCHF